MGTLPIGLSFLMSFRLGALVVLIFGSMCFTQGSSYSLPGHLWNYQCRALSELSGGCPPGVVAGNRGTEDRRELVL